MTDGEYIGAQDAARILKVSARMVYRYAEGADAKIRSLRAGRRILFNRNDVLAYATEIDAANKPEVQTSIIPADEMLALVRDQQNQIAQMARTIGYLEAQLEQRLLPADADALKHRVIELEHERAQLQQALELERHRSQAALTNKRRSLWRRFFGT